MTRITYSPETRRLTLRGHAGAGVYGSDPVCAALSIVTYALIDAGAAGTLSDGAASLTLPDADMSLAFRAYRLLAENFPENVCFEEMNDHG